MVWIVSVLNSSPSPDSPTHPMSWSEKGTRDKGASEVKACQIRQRLLESNNRIVADVQFETRPLITPTAVSPNDTLFVQQWDMTRIQAGGAGTTGAGRLCPCIVGVR